jgi:hypothetical protein
MWCELWLHPRRTEQASSSVSAKRNPNQMTNAAGVYEHTEYFEGQESSVVSVSDDASFNPGRLAADQR